MNNLSGPIVVEEDATHFLVGIHYNDRHLARDIEGRAWSGEKRRWTWKKSKQNYENLIKTFKGIAERFDISDQNLTTINEQGETDPDKRTENATEGEWGFMPTTDLYLQFAALQRIEDKIDEMMASRLVLENNGESEREKDHPDDKVLLEDTRPSNYIAPMQVQEIVAALTSDKAFEKLVLSSGEAHQSSIQRLHNIIRDEIKKIADVEDEEIHKTVAASKRFSNNNPYRKQHVSLYTMTVFAEEKEFYETPTGELDIYKALHFFNQGRNALEKYNQSSAMGRILGVIYLSLGWIIWSKVRMQSTEEEVTELEIMEEH